MLTQLALLLFPLSLSAGLTFPCPEGCGGDNDPIRLEIVHEFSDVIRKICETPSSEFFPFFIDNYFPNQEYLYPTNGEKYRTFWEFNDQYIKTYRDQPHPFAGPFEKRYSYLRNYQNFLEFWNIFESEVIYGHESYLRYLNRELMEDQKDLQKCDPDWESKTIASLLRDINATHGKIRDVNAKYQQDQSYLYSSKLKIDALYDQLISYCLTNHGFIAAIYQAGLMHFQQGYADVVISDIDELIDKLRNEQVKEEFISELHQMKGISHYELNQYNEAIIALTKAIELQPKNRENYLERAAAYFETGNFEKSLEDFLLSKTENNRLLKTQFDYATDLVKGIQDGLEEAMKNFLPSLLNSAQGLSHGIWAFACDPKSVTKEMIDTTKACIEFVRSSPSKETLKILAPELGKLLDEWNTLTEKDRGQIAGTIIGKYGTDFFLTAGSAKAIKTYRDLSHANKALTLERASHSKKADKITEVAKKYENSHFKSQEIRNQAKYALVKHVKDLETTTGKLSEKQIHEALHQYGFHTFERPKGIPEHWDVKLADTGSGIKYINPQNNHHSVRVMDADPFSEFASQRRPYVMEMKDGAPVDKLGKRLNAAQCAEAHIPIEDYTYRG